VFYNLNSFKHSKNHWQGTLTNLSAGFVDSLNNGTIYLEIQTAANPNGELRGQLERRNPLTLTIDLDGGQVVPSTGSLGHGTGYMILNEVANNASIFIVYSDLNSGATYANLFNGEFGVAGTAVRPLTYFDGVINTVINAPFTGSLVRLALTGNLNVNLGTTSNPSGALRGQLFRGWRDAYTYILDGTQENQPLFTPAYGSGVVSISNDLTDIHYMLVFDSLATPATAAHFHAGPRGRNGSVVFNVTNTFDNVTTPRGTFGYWRTTSSTPLTLQRILQLKRDSLYLNVHNSVYPSGEVRTQLQNRGNGQYYTLDGARTAQETAYCNRTYGLINNSKIVASEVFGAQRYRFSLRNNAGEEVSSYVNFKPLLDLEQVSPALAYGTSYRVFVQPFVHRQYRPIGQPVGPCFIMTAMDPNTQPSTNLRSTDCGRSVDATTDILGADELPGAQSYTFYFATDSVDVFNSPDFTFAGEGRVRRLELANTTGLVAGTTYFVGVRSATDNVMTPIGSICTVIITIPTPRLAGNASGSAQNFTAYPNPFQNTMTVQLAGPASVELMDMAGRVIERSDVASAGTVSVGGRLAEGSYILRAVYADGTMATMPIVKQN
jgi:hypothetical protein